MIIEYGLNFTDDEWRYKAQPLKQLTDVTRIFIEWFDSATPYFIDSRIVQIDILYAPSDGYQSSHHRVTMSKALLDDCDWSVMIPHLASYLRRERDELILQLL